MTQKSQDQRLRFVADKKVISIDKHFFINYKGYL